MTSITVGLAQLNTTVGALDANADKIAAMAEKAAKDGADIIVFPELALSGYPPEDLILKQHFVDDCETRLDSLAKRLPSDRVVIVGSPTGTRGQAYNAAVVFHGGWRAGEYRKMLLPNYGVFDEKRVFLPGDKPGLLSVGGARIGLHICEDSWFTGAATCTALQPLQPDALINLSASPYHRGKWHIRADVLGKTARFLKTHLLYCNLVGGQDELVFDGASIALRPDGEIVARARQFAEDMMLITVPLLGKKPAPAGEQSVHRIQVEYVKPEAPPKLVAQPMARIMDDVEEVYAALQLGLRDYTTKNGFSRAVVALSGGIDSALVAAIAVDALGRDKVVGITLPSQFSSKETRGDAEVLAHNLGIEFHALPIQPVFEKFLGDIQGLWPGRPPDTTEENLQARIRGTLVMALSNKFGWLVLTTGNKSELATGYCTLYGDMAGGFAVIKDVPKTLVFELAAWRNRQGHKPVIPPSTIARPPSAELRPNQKDSDSLPPYDALDPILELYVEQDLSAEDIIARGHDADMVHKTVRLVDLNEYKRRQGAPGIKITPKAFGRDRRMPITNLYR